MEEYYEFLKRKGRHYMPSGFCVESLNLASFGDRHQFQPHVIQWALNQGKAAIYARYGMGKTRMLLEWANHVASHESCRVISLAPLAVGLQTEQEAQKFGIPAKYCRSQSEASKADEPIVITNYERLRDFDCSGYKAVVLDESAILKQYQGKTKLALIEAFKDKAYRLACSALPSPNNHLELGNQSEWLGIMDSHEMISRWFINDPKNVGVYKLKAFAARSFWEWVASWAVCLTMPSDLGFSDDGWNLPENHYHYHDIDVDLMADVEPDRNGQIPLFRIPTLNATSIHKEARINCDRMAQAIGDLVNNSNANGWAIWCFTDYESEALMKYVKNAVELKGSEPIQRKEQKLIDFTLGKIPILITKPKIAGLGLNWQHINHQAFMMGTSYSFEQFDQAVHRLHRFGQEREVQTHVFYPATATKVKCVIEQKREASRQMQSELRKAIKRIQLAQHDRLNTSDYDPSASMQLPHWIGGKKRSA